MVPSWSDSCPNTVLEALYNEIAVIGSKAGGIPEILIDKDSLFDLNKVSLKESILRFVEDNHALKLLRDRQLKIISIGIENTMILLYDKMRTFRALDIIV